MEKGPITGPFSIPEILFPELAFQYFPRHIST